MEGSNPELNCGSRMLTGLRKHLLPLRDVICHGHTRECNNGLANHYGDGEPPRREIKGQLRIL